MACIWVEGQDGRDAFRAGDLAGMDHDTDLHESRVDLATASVDDVDIILPNGLRNANIALANAALGHLCPS